MSTIRPVPALDARSRHRSRALGVLLAVTVGLAGSLTVPAAPAGANVAKSRVTLFVHGYNATSNSTDCGKAFDPMIEQLRDKGFTGPMIRVGFYSGDKNCDVNLRKYRDFGDHDSWKLIAQAFSRYVYDAYTSKGIKVDVVGYSMGGLIARGAVYGAQQHHNNFSPPIDVEDVVTLGTPHRGVGAIGDLCLWGQCKSLKAGHGDLKWLNGNGNPQGSSGTDWTNVSSRRDTYVPMKSATSMDIRAVNKVIYKYIRHDGPKSYLYNADVITRVGQGLTSSVL